MPLGTCLEALRPWCFHLHNLRRVLSPPRAGDVALLTCEHSLKGWVTTLEASRGMEGGWGLCWGPWVMSGAIRVALCLWGCQARSASLRNGAAGCHKDPWCS